MDKEKKKKDIKKIPLNSENIVYGRCVSCGGPLTNDHKCPEWIGHNNIEQRFEIIQQIGLKDVYLPFVLTKLKICGTNTEGRQLITQGKVKINNNVVDLRYNTKELCNFLLEVDGVKYEIFKID